MRTPIVLNHLYKKYTFKRTHKRIVIRGFVNIKNGPYNRRFENHFTGNFLLALVNHIGMDHSLEVTSGMNKGPTSTWLTSTTNSFMVLGTNTTTATTLGLAGLVVPIGAAPGTKPNSQAGAFVVLGNGNEIDFTATWNAGTVSGTVGEIGLWLYLNILTKTFGWNAPNSDDGASLFASRLSVADGDFAAFAINVANPLSITWQIQFTFA